MSEVTTAEGLQRRLGFVSILLWVGFIGGAFDTVARHEYTAFRLIYVPAVLIFAVLLTSAWWMVRKGSKEK
jgi:membrane protein DedA with SNARE-associated domain